MEKDDVDDDDLINDVDGDDDEEKDPCTPCWKNS